MGGWPRALAMKHHNTRMNARHGVDCVCLPDRENGGMGISMLWCGEPERDRWNDL